MSKSITPTKHLVRVYELLLEPMVSQRMNLIMIHLEV